MAKLNSLKSIIHLANRIAARNTSKDVSEQILDGDMLDDEPSDLFESDSEMPEDLSDVGDDGLESDITSDTTEYSCKIDLSIIADFEGVASKAALLKGIRKSLQLSLKSGIEKLANDMQLGSVDVKVMPITIDCSVMDESNYGLDEYGEPLDTEDSDEEDSDEEDSDEEDSDEEDSDEEDSDGESDEEEDSDEDDSDEEEESDEDDSDEEEESDEDEDEQDD